MAEFVTCFQKKTINKSGIIPRLRRSQRILRFCNFKKEKEPDRYYKEQLLLFLPWRDEYIEKEGIDWASKYNEFVDVITENRKKFCKIDIAELEQNIISVEENESNSEIVDVLPKELRKDLAAENEESKPDKYGSNISSIKYVMPVANEEELLNHQLQRLNERQR